MHLPAEEVEVVRRGGDVANLPIRLLDLRPGVQSHIRGDLVRGFVRHLEVPLHAAARVLRPLPVVPVREQERDARLRQPLGLAAADELVDDDLSAVGEIAKLSLPHDQRVGVLKRVPELKP